MAEASQHVVTIWQPEMASLFFRNFASGGKPARLSLVVQRPVFEAIPQARSVRQGNSSQVAPSCCATRLSARACHAPWRRQAAAKGCAVERTPAASEPRRASAMHSDQVARRWPPRAQRNTRRLWHRAWPTIRHSSQHDSFCNYVFRHVVQKSCREMVTDSQPKMARFF